MTTIAFFGHDVADAAVRRRVRAMTTDGMRVIGFMMRRDKAAEPDWENVDLGTTRDSAFLQRIFSIFSGARRAAEARDRLAEADVIYARNLDMLACAFLARRHARLDMPVIYESLDVHRLLTRPDLIGKAMRWLERRLLKQTAALVVSSPAFLKNHFERHYAGAYRAFLIENRLPESDCPEPIRNELAQRESSHPLRIGWVGILRCKRSFNLLCRMADAFPDSVEIYLHGTPARTEISVFEPEIDARANMHWFGRYTAPDDLPRIYASLDLVWAGDFMEAGYNSLWLLPNRIYEGGYYGTPSIAPEGTETARWIESHVGGFVIAEPLERTLPELIRNLLADRSQIARYRTNLQNLPSDVFVEPRGFIRSVIDNAIGEGVAA